MLHLYAFWKCSTSMSAPIYIQKYSNAPASDLGPSLTFLCPFLYLYSSVHALELTQVAAAEALIGGRPVAQNLVDGAHVVGREAPRNLDGPEVLCELLGLRRAQEDCTHALVLDAPGDGQLAHAAAETLLRELRELPNLII